MVLQIDGAGKNLSSPLFSETAIPETFFSWNKDDERSKNNEKISCLQRLCK